jgi:hypothetical protein
MLRPSHQSRVSACATWAGPVGLAAFSLAAALSLGLAPPAQGPVAALFPPWWGGAKSLLAASGAGAIIRFGALPSIVIVQPAAPGGSVQLHHLGAWAVLDPQVFGGCGATSQQR